MRRAEPEQLVIIVEREERSVTASVRTQGPSIRDEQYHILSADYRRRGAAVKDAMSARVILRVAKRTRGAQAIQRRMSGKMRILIIPQMIQEVLVHD
jgi:hypothetical protein